MGLNLRLVKIRIKKCTCSFNHGLILVPLIDTDAYHGVENTAPYSSAVKSDVS